MKKLFLLFALIVGLLTSVSTLQAQVNMNSYITLTVKSGKVIRLNFKAGTSNTPVRIVSGSNTQDITLNATSWYGTASYIADGTTMTVYGDLESFDCYGNGENLTAIDLSHNTQLTKLDCASNLLTTLDVSQNTELQKLDCRDNLLTTLNVSKITQLTELWCSSNQLTSLDVSKNTHLEWLSCCNNTLNSLDVSGCTQLNELYCYDNPFTTAALDHIYCALPDRNGSTYPGRIHPVYNASSPNHATVLASNKTNATSKNWKVQYDDDTDIPATTGNYVCGTPYPVDTSRYITLTVSNGEVIKLDFKAAAANTSVRIVSGSNTQNITVGTDWIGTASYTADGTEMTVYGDITDFDCQYNGANISALDPSHNKLLMWLYCQNNGLSSLDVSNNTQLTELYCFSNNLSSLDVSHNTQLQKLICHSNKFSAQTLDDIYCTLPYRTSKYRGVIKPVFNSSSSYNDTVLATNAQNAIYKNWKVQYYDDGNDISATTGTYVCGTPHTDIAKATAEPALTLYPNPVADVLYLSATARTVRVYDIYGIEVAHATDTDRVEVSHLPAGIYTVRADGTVAKMVKR